MKSSKRSQPSASLHKAFPYTQETAASLEKHKQRLAPPETGCDVSAEIKKSSVEETNDLTTRGATITVGDQSTLESPP